MKGSELIKALEEGKLLEKDYSLAESEYYKHTPEGECVKYLFHQKSYGFEVKGWASAIGTIGDVIMEILNNPEKWRISKYKIEDYPWSSNFKK